LEGGPRGGGFITFLWVCNGFDLTRKNARKFYPKGKNEERGTKRGGE